MHGKSFQMLKNIYYENMINKLNIYKKHRLRSYFIFEEIIKNDKF